MTKANATTEQKINGQIGHPAACMIESKVFPRGDRRLCCSIMTEARNRFQTAFRTNPSPSQGVHSFCGQICGQPGSKRAEPAPVQAQSWFALFLSTVFCMQIKHLHDHDRSVTRRCRPPGWCAALVEYRVASAPHGDCC